MQKRLCSRWDIAVEEHCQNLRVYAYLAGWLHGHIYYSTVINVAAQDLVNKRKELANGATLEDENYH